MTTVRVLLNTREAADRLRVSPGTMRNWRSYGTGPAWIGSGKSTRYDVDVLDAWLASGAERHDVPSTMPAPIPKLASLADVLPPDVWAFARTEALERGITPAAVIHDCVVGELARRVLRWSVAEDTNEPEHDNRNRKDPDPAA